MVASASEDTTEDRDSMMTVRMDSMVMMIISVQALVVTTAATVARGEKEEKVAKVAVVPSPTGNIPSCVKRITIGIPCTGTIKTMPSVTVGTRDFGTPTLTTWAEDTSPVEEDQDTIPVAMITDTTPLVVVRTITVTVTIINNNRSTILRHLLTN